MVDAPGDLAKISHNHLGKGKGGEKEGHCQRGKVSNQTNLYSNATVRISATRFILNSYGSGRLQVVHPAPGRRGERGEKEGKRDNGERGEGGKKGPAPRAPFRLTLQSAFAPVSNTTDGGGKGEDTILVKKKQRRRSSASATPCAKSKRRPGGECRLNNLLYQQAAAGVISGGRRLGEKGTGRGREDSPAPTGLVGICLNCWCSNPLQFLGRRNGFPRSL